MYEGRDILANCRRVISGYVHNSNIPGYKYLTRKSTLERYFWYMVHLCTLASTFLLIKYSWDEFMVNPIITTVESFTYPINNVPIPGISICNGNKISRMMPESYAEKLSNMSGTPKEDILPKIIELSRFYDLELQSDGEPPVAFQNLLDTYNPGPEGYCNIHNTLKMLMSPCSKIITDCVIHNVKRDCEDLFVPELTMEGHCCIFNYVSQSSTMISKILKENRYRTVTAGDVRIDGDLTFKLLFNISDYTSTIFPSLSTQILISLPTDFPDKSSGDLREVLVGAGVETFLQISSVTTFSTPEIKKYSVSQRKCIFRDERNTIFDGYSFSDCIMDCKIKSIQDICKCVPFNYIKAFKQRHFNQCTLADLECLSSNFRKWLTLYPGDHEVIDDESEKEDRLYCAHCLPACSDYMYTIKTQSGKIFRNGQTINNFSVVHITFSSSYGTINKQDAIFYWFEITGLFGGLCSLMIGATFINIVEIIYFFGYLFWKK